MDYNLMACAKTICSALNGLGKYSPDALRIAQLAFLMAQWSHLNVHRKEMEYLIELAARIDQVCQQEKEPEFSHYDVAEALVKNQRTFAPEILIKLDDQDFAARCLQLAGEQRRKRQTQLSEIE